MTNTVTSLREPLSLPPFPTLDGREVDLGSLRGGKVLLFMWGSW